jgi:serine/threonine-protein kinase
MTDVAVRLGAALGARYRLEGELGRGGMATVYLAEDLKHGRPVAVKALRPDLTATLGAERFLREIGIAARLSHPHLLPLIDSGETDGLLWSVSPYIAGGSLRARLEQAGGRLAVEEALRVVREVGMGLDFVHRNGFVHRDIKPENILFADDHAVLADFGIARACCGPGAANVTETGMALGTPAYMSPEAAAGDPDLQAPSDLYSLACVLYEMLTGAPPFTGDTGRAVMARHVTSTPKALRAIRPDVPGALDAAMERALAKDPKDRFPSVAEFVAAVQAGGPAPRPAAVDRCVAVLPFINASPDPDNEYLSDGITDELIAALAKVEGLRVASRTSVFALKGRAQDVRALGALLGASEVLEGTVRRGGDRLRITAQLTSADDGRLLWSERYDRRLDDVLAIQDEIARTIVDTLRATSFADIAAPARRRSTANVEAYRLYLRGRYAWNRRTQEGVAEGIRCFEQAIALDPAYALAYTGLADGWALQLDYRSVPVHEGFEKAKLYARKALELDDTLAEAHASLAWSLFIYDWDWEGSRREFQRAIALEPGYATAHQWYAFQLVSEARFDEALVEAHTAQELDPASISIRRTLGFCYYYARRYEQAGYHCRRAIAMNPAAEESHRVLGLVLIEQGKPEESVRVMREAAAMPGAASYSRAMYGHALARAGRADEARRVLAELAAEATRGYVSPVAFATIHASLGDVDPAIDWIEKAIAERRGWPAYLRVHPIADPLRGSPRFQSLLERMRLV